MKISIFGALIVAALSTSATAGSVAGPVVEAPVVAPAMAASTPTADWGGFYGGLSYGQATGETNYYSAPGVFDNGDYVVEGNLPGLFAGYNVQRGNLVYGGELSAVFGEVRGTPDGFEEQQYEGVIDLKARGGYAFGSALVYGSLGYSVSPFAEDGEPLQAMTGLGYGVGVDYQIAERYVIGAEFYRRELNGTLDYAPTYELDDSGFDTFSVRLGMQF
ncbi:Outer membrane protein beta-barrel domain-containing protein [Yoonia tamlensis]|uniref:Outer membrane protein beta-barrel domain-containing protein n=1 Tax=Yoonia tamlensis TaxID=390270 RepID=A0A1I6GTV1_9RHOB|nr:outer membrane beta-barrel protein [Yoonia tamlensis]SFR45693.1 Outer membrane protein beta-barrel domain-containing protein [Yoonia tamlensis]